MIRAPPHSPLSATSALPRWGALFRRSHQSTREVNLARLGEGHVPQAESPRSRVPPGSAHLPPSLRRLSSPPGPAHSRPDYEWEVQRRTKAHAY